MLLYCIQSKGLVDNCFLAHCFHGCNEHVIIIISPQELYECFPRPQELYNSKYMDVSPTRGVCITYTLSCIPWQPHSNGLETYLFSI